MNTQAAIEIRNVTKCFGANEVIKDCEMTAAQGAVYGLLGANGAGKTTLFKLLTGLLNPDCGSIEVLGENLQKNRDTMLSKMGSLIETPVFYEHLSAGKNLELHLQYMGVQGLGIDEVLQMTGLPDTKDKPVRKFSLGMRQRLGIARALIHRPRLLILDEPLNGLDPMGIRQMRELFEKLTEEYGMTVLLSGHALHEIELTADKIGVIAQGRIISEETMEKIKAQYSDGLEEYYFTVANRGERA